MLWLFFGFFLWWNLVVVCVVDDVVDGCVVFECVDFVGDLFDGFCV